MYIKNRQDNLQNLDVLFRNSQPFFLNQNQHLINMAYTHNYIQMEPESMDFNQGSDAYQKELSIGEQTLRKLLYSNDYPSKQLQQQIITKLPTKKYFGILSLMKKIIKTQQEIQYTARTAHFIINVILHYRFGDKLLSAFLEVLGKHKVDCKHLYDIQFLKSLLPYIPESSLPDYYYAFEIQLPDPERLFKLGSDLISRNHERQALKLAEISKNIDLFYMLLKTSNIKKKIIYTAIRKCGIKPEECPEIYRETLLSSMRHWMNEGYDYLQEVFCGSWQVMAIGLRKPVFDGNVKALSICKRNPEIVKYFDKADQPIIKKKLNNFSKYVPNQLQINIFGPSNPHKQFSLKDYKITQENIKFITSNQQSVKYISEFVEKLSLTTKIGIDTESRISKSAFDPHSDLLEIIQIAIGHEIYLIDVKANLKSPELQYAIISFVSDPSHQIIGHTTQEDVNLMWRGLIGHKAPNLIKCQIIDIGIMYRQIFKAQKFSLACMCEHLFKKELCKKYTITNWHRRPLLLNQIHYAALDAFIVIRMHEELELIHKNSQQHH